MPCVFQVRLGEPTFLSLLRFETFVVEKFFLVEVNALFFKKHTRVFEAHSMLRGNMGVS